MSADVPSVRYRPIDRTQRSLVSLDEQLPDDHPVRDLWDFTAHLDLSAFERPDKAVEGHPGAPVIPARLLFALWLYATIEGVCSSRRLAELTTRDLPYQWLCGGGPVGHHTLSDFYSRHESALHALFVEHVAALRQHGLIDLSEVTVDGRKVPASASKESFHRQPTLERHLTEAEEHLRRLQGQRDQAATTSARQQAARLRGARQRRDRLKQAVHQVQQRQQQRQETGREHVKPDEARASETDPDAVKMKRADGGFRACYNVQTVTSAKSELIVTVSVCQQSSDNGLLGEVLYEVHREQGELPKAVLADSGYTSLDDVKDLEGDRKIEVLMPPKNERKELKAGQDPYARKRRDNEAIARWRGRLGSPEGRARYRRRSPVAEGVHAQQSNRGFKAFRLRGQGKAATESYWQALAHNVRKLLTRQVDLGNCARRAKD